MICLNSTTPTPSRTSLLSMAECVSKFGVCAETLRRWDKSGKITSYRINARSHRRFDPKEIAQAMGLEVKTESTGAIPVVYARTSSESQKESLCNQITKMRAEVSQLEDIPTSQVKVYQDNASAYGDRPQLNLLVEDCISGLVSKIYVLWEDRLSRSPCLTRLLESICKNRGIEICVIESECLDKDEMEIAFAECMMLINIVVNKKNGRRGGAKVKKSMDDETLKLCYSMYKDGQSIRMIEKELERRGIKDPQNRYYKRGVIQNRIAENLKVFQVLNNDQPKNNCVEFLQKYVKKCRGKRCTSRAAIARAYKAYCEETNQMVGSASHLTKSIDKVFPNIARTKNKNREVFYHGVILTTNTKTKGRGKR